MKKLLTVLLAAVFLLAGCGKSEENPENTSVSVTTTSPEVPAAVLNHDLISDIGKNYEQLFEKYKGVMQAFDDDGMLVTIAQDSGLYEFVERRGIYRLIETDDELICYYINDIKIEDLFIGITLPTNMYELKKVAGMEFLFDNPLGMSFSYIEDPNISINLATPDKGSIAEDGYSISLMYMVN